MAQRRHLAHRVDREIGGRLHRRAVIEDFGAIGTADLFQHPAHDPAARHRVGVEHEFVSHRYCLGLNSHQLGCAAYASAGGAAMRGRAVGFDREAALARLRAMRPKVHNLSRRPARRRCRRPIRRDRRRSPSRRRRSRCRAPIRRPRRCRPLAVGTPLALDGSRRAASRYQLCLRQPLLPRPPTNPARTRCFSNAGGRKRSP